MQELTSIHLQLSSLDKKIAGRNIFCAEDSTYIVVLERGIGVLGNKENPEDNRSLV
jgi:hypothetical protein